MTYETAISEVRADAAAELLNDDSAMTSFFTWLDIAMWNTRRNNETARELDSYIGEWLDTDKGQAFLNRWAESLMDRSIL